MRATEAPGGLSLGFFTLGFARFSPEMLAFDSLDNPNERLPVPA